MNQRLPKAKYPFDDRDAIHDDPTPNPFATPFATIPTLNPFATIPFVTILFSTIPIGDDLIDFDDSYWWWSRRFQFPLVMTSTIPIPIGDDPWWFWFPFATLIHICDADSHSRRSSLHRGLCSELVSFYFIYFIFFSPSLFTFMFICLGSRTGGKTRIGINGMFSYKYSCCVLFWFVG